jgi:cathepsin L
LEENGQALETSYPYDASTKAGSQSSCQTSLATGDVSVQNYADVPEYSAAGLKGAIEQGVVSVTVEADKEVFHHYTGGIINSAACGTQLDHAIASVGWGTDETVGDYYIVRNSWTEAWGEQGYVRIAAVENTEGICGIQMESTIPTTN